jgi:ABC-type branched-subunit amino acid transport system ATPase component
VRPARRTWFSDFLGITPRRGEKTEAPRAPDPTRLPPIAAGARAAAEGGAVPATGSPILDARDMRVRFGGVPAVDGVDLSLDDGEILGLVGPNGSGKTTFLNALSGVVEASGHAEVLGTPIRLGQPGRIRAFGVLRTYQAPQTYAHLTCLEDVLLSTPDRAFSGMTSSWFVRPAVDAHERARWGAARRSLEQVGLDALAEEPTARLSYGQRRLLELARAIHARPRALLLDEPSAGLNATETDQLARHLARLKHEGIPILLVDHKLDFITSLCDRIAVLELGRLVAIGPAETVFSDARVIDAYLGVDEEG